MFFSFIRFFLLIAIGFPSFGTGHEGAKIKKTSLEIPKDLENFERVRISLIDGAPEITIETPSPYRILDGEGRTLFKGDRIVATRVRVNQAGIQIGNQTFQNTPLTLESEGEGIKVGSHLYRQAVKIWRVPNNTLSVVNEIAVEDYLKGVLPWEANPKWPLEALKAQAVAARTYAIFKAVENQKERAVLSNDVLSQVYKGKNAENPATNQAVDQTRGEVLSFKGKIFPAYFHSTCGGATTHAEYLWDVEPHPALKGVACSFCRMSKHYRWQIELSQKEIEAKLRKKGVKVAGIRQIMPVDIDDSGRARFFLIEHQAGKLKVHSNDFRLWLDPARIKSTLISSISHESDHFIFKGHGWGHGVGMCQYGMKGLAELGYTYRQILDFYYPGAEITNIHTRPAS